MEDNIESEDILIIYAGYQYEKDHNTRLMEEYISIVILLL